MFFHNVTEKWLLSLESETSSNKMKKFLLQIWYLKGNKYMLFASWEVHMVKNCDQGLENAAGVDIDDS